MIRLDLKKQLIEEVFEIYSYMSRYTGDANPGIKNRSPYMGAIPKKLKRAADKSILKDFLLGLKAIDKKNPVYIEMPTLKSESDGMYSESFESDDKILSDSKEIIVADPIYLTQNKQE